MWELGGSSQSLWCHVRVELQLHWLSCWQDTPSRCWIESISSSMSRDKMKGSNVTQWCIVNVCASLGDPEKPKIVHNWFWYRTLFLNFFEIQKIIFLSASSLPVLSWNLLILWCSWINWNQQFSYLDFLSSKNQNQWLFDSENF